MFGANDTTVNSNDDPAMLDNVKQLANEPASQVTPAQPQFMTSSPISSPAPDPSTPMGPQQSSDDQTTDTSMPSAVAEPAQGFSSSPLPEPPTTPMDQTMQNNDTPVEESQDTVDDTPIAAATMQPVDPNQLAGMKQEALDHLEPLVDHLDQSPEESFKTTMMMIQANDNHTLLEKALAEAKKIEDDKTRANAMLDIINEINYFSQNSQQ